MRNGLEDGRLQVVAPASLLENSRLVEWISSHAHFVSVPRDIFEYSIRRDVDPIFGRLICWILFSAGAEFLAKGICLLKGIEIRSEHEVPTHPSSNLQTWILGFRKDWKSQGVMKAPNFGTLGDLLRNKKGGSAPLKMLCSRAGATAMQEDLLFVAYDLLRKTIRNRDAHAYIPNVRDSHYSLVPDLFCECFNLLLSWLPNGSKTLNDWKVEVLAGKL